MFARVFLFFYFVFILIDFFKCELEGFGTEKGERRRTRLDSVDGRVGEGAHGAGDEPDKHVLVRRQLDEIRLQPMRELLQLLIRREIRA